MPHSGPHFSIFWRVLMPKCSILGPLAAQLRPKMATKIAQVAPIMLKKIDTGPPWDRSWTRAVSRITFGAFLGTILVDLGWIFHDFLWIFV